MNDIICYDINDIISVTKEGLVLKSAKEKIHINFGECAKNFSLEKGREFCRCVATRDITTLSYTFYTQPKTNIVFKKSFFKDLISGKFATSKFFSVQKAIVEAGYISYDLS